MEKDRKDLKIEHYRQRVAQLSVEYEEKIADLRIQVTLDNEEIARLNQVIAGFKEPDETEKADTAPTE